VSAAVREALVRELASLEAELARITATPTDPLGAVSFGKRVGDGTAQAVERITQVSAADRLDAKRVEVVRAIAKCDDGTYGRCDACGAAIDADRLEAVPQATRCIACARAAAR
jgi:DnaK suppressor protein